MSEELPPLPSDIRDLIARDSRHDALPDETRRRLYRNVGAAILAGSATAVAVSATAKGAGVLGALFTRKGAVAVMAFAIGGAAGAGGYAVADKLGSAPASVPVCPSIVATSAPTTPATHTPVFVPEPSPTPSVSVSASASIPPPPPPSASAPKSELEAEKALIDRARNAFLHGNAGNALDAVNEHQKRFPSGVLSEEREFHAIRALHQLGQNDAANKRFEGFRARYPKSLYTESLEKLLGK